MLVVGEPFVVLLHVLFLGVEAGEEVCQVALLDEIRGVDLGSSCDSCRSTTSDWSLLKQLNFRFSLLDPILE